MVVNDVYCCFRDLGGCVIVLEVNGYWDVLLLLVDD